MMRRLSYGILMVLLLAACGKENQDPLWDGPVMELTVSCLDAQDPTKAGSDGTAAGENPYHENLIKWVDFYFYPGGATSESATYHIRKESGKRGSDVFRLELTTNQVNYRIFPVLSGITEATVFAIANGPKDLLDNLDDTSLSSIESLLVTTDFAAPTVYTSHSQEYFMMSGSETITLAGRSQKVVSQGLVNLSRYASKITVGIKMSDRVELSDGEVWVPRPQEMKIYLENGMKVVSLGGQPAGTTGRITPSTEDYLSYKDNPLYFFSGGEPYFDKSGDYYNTFPMYTYPYHWVSGAEHEPYIKLVMTWDRLEEGGYSHSQKEFYYKILIPVDRRGGDFMNSFIRNNWYHYDINVGVLGADTDEDAVELTAEMFLVYWQEKDMAVKQANIGSARYLSVEGTHFEMYNQSSIKVIYTSSSPIKLENIHVTRPYFGENPQLDYNERYRGDVKQVHYGDGDTYDDIYPDNSYYLEYNEQRRKDYSGDGKDWIQYGDGAIVYTHALENNYSSQQFEYSPYTITFDVFHADATPTLKKNYIKHVEIIQYPGIFIQATPNPDDIKDSGEQSTTKHHGYVYINGEQFTQKDYEDGGKQESDLWRVVTYNGGGTDMYKISATVLPADSEFIIGDPRVGNAQSAEEMGYTFCEANTVKKDDQGKEVVDTETKRSLTYYHLTDGSDRTKNMIAPAYRVSTKLSGSARSTQISKENALKRCASIQENGFPAGRWRLPTQGEISFIAQLSANGVFVKQFDDNYWTANGVVQVKNNKVTPNPTATKAYIRCVYDSWYWGDDRIVDGNGDPTLFVWGDAQ